MKKKTKIPNYLEIALFNPLKILHDPTGFSQVFNSFKGNRKVLRLSIY